MTAVEWLGIELNMLFTDITEEQWNRADELFEQAKEMEKEHLIKFYIKGCDDTYGMDEEDDDRKDAEKHYKEIFKSE